MVLISFFLSRKVLVHFNDSALTDSADPPCFHPHFVWSVCSVPVGVLDFRNGCCYLERGLSVVSTHWPVLPTQSPELGGLEEIILS